MPLNVDTKLLREGFCFILKPFQHILLVLVDPLDVGLGLLDGLVHRQGPRTKSNGGVVLLELLQLLTKT